MIVTSYTSLVFESHKADCANLLSGIARRTSHRIAAGPVQQAYREREMPLPPLAAPALVPVETTELISIAPGKIRGAA